jgi:hypothetical protein
MTSFEKVKKGILKDMDASRTHTAMSWANIMLRNCNRLTSVAEQHKFWEWFTNPEDDELPPVVCEKFEHCHISTPKYTTAPTDDEKTPDVTFENTYTRNGCAMHVVSKPVNTETA